MSRTAQQTDDCHQVQLQSKFSLHLTLWLPSGRRVQKRLPTPRHTARTHCVSMPTKSSEPGRQVGLRLVFSLKCQEQSGVYKTTAEATAENSECGHDFHSCTAPRGGQVLPSCPVLAAHRGEGGLSASPHSGVSLGICSSWRARVSGRCFTLHRSRWFCQWETRTAHGQGHSRCPGGARVT